MLIWEREEQGCERNTDQLHPVPPNGREPETWTRARPGIEPAASCCQDDTPTNPATRQGSPAFCLLHVPLSRNTVNKQQAKVTARVVPAPGWTQRVGCEQGSRLGCPSTVPASVAVTPTVCTRPQLATLLWMGNSVICSFKNKWLEVESVGQGDEC